VSAHVNRARGALHALTAVAVVAGVACVLWAPAPATNAGAAALSRDGKIHSSHVVRGFDSYAPAHDGAFQIEPVTTRPKVVPTTTQPAPAPAASHTSSVMTPPTTVAPTAVPWQPQTVARLKATTLVYANPGDAHATSALLGVTEFGNPRVLPVTQQSGTWLRVQLPTRPNGSQGWILARDASVSTVDDRVDVDLSTRTLTWSHSGVVRVQAVVGVGAPNSPTPTGNFFVTDVLPGEGPEYGAWIVALDAHSDVFTEFEGGDARIAIHGTNDPSSIGRAASSGCVRADARTLAALAASLPAGTPVDVE
jgi:lipoprotein-anchoring transpeptidase ErfK/SrfK